MSENEPVMIRRTTNMTMEEYLASLETTAATPTARPQSQRQTYQTYQPSEGNLPTSRTPEYETHRGIPILRNMSKRAIAITSGIALVAGAGAFGYSNDVMGSQEILASVTAHDALDSNGIYATKNVETLGPQALSEPYCEASNATLIEATITGEMPLIPLAPTAESKTPVKASPYMIQKNVAAVDAKDQPRFQRLVHDSMGGYQKATLQKMTVAAVACEITNAASAATGVTAVSTVGNVVTIHNDLIHVEFKDPNELFNDSSLISPIAQTDSIANLNLDPQAGETMTYPAGIYAHKSGDDTFNAAIAATSKSMQTPEQLQVITSTMEKSAIDQLNDVYADPNVTYKDPGVKKLWQAIDKAVLQRVVGNTSKTVHHLGSYNTDMYTPKDPTTKQSIVTPDPKTGASAIKGFMASKFKIDSITVETGTLEPMKSQKPKPTATVTPSPTATTAK